MPDLIDPYEPCPCMSGKKIRFCCSKDIINELDKVYRLLNGDQSAAALSAIDRITAKHGPRITLLSVKASLHAGKDEFEALRATVEQMSQLAPKNCLTLAYEAQVLALDPNVTAEAALQAKELIFEALAQIPDNTSAHVFVSMQVVGHTMVNLGEALAAYGLLRLTAGLGQQVKDETSLRFLAHVEANADLSTVVKREIGTPLPPESLGDVPWKEAYEEVYDNLAKPLWWLAEKQLQELLRQHPDALELQRAHAVTLFRLGRLPEALRAYRRFSTHPRVDPVDALDAECLAQVLEIEDPETPHYEQVIVTFKVEDAESVTERLLSDKRVSDPPGADPLDWITEEDEPDPKKIFLASDRPFPSDPGVAFENLPTVRFPGAFFGRETDRSARLKVRLTDDDRYEDNLSLLREIVGESFDEPMEREVVAFVPRGDEWDGWRKQLPSLATVDLKRRLELLKDMRRAKVVDGFLHSRVPCLDFKAPEEASNDPKYELPLAARLLVMEVDSLEGEAELITELREKLGCPPPAPVRIEEKVQLRDLPMTRFHYLDKKALSDDHVLLAVRIALQLGSTVAVDALLDEALNRDEVPALDRMELVSLAVREYGASPRSLEILSQGQQIAREHRHSTFPLEVAELEICVYLGERDRVRELLDELPQRCQANEEHQELFIQSLIRLRLLNPDGSIPDGPNDGEPTEAGTSSGIWTPDQGQPGGGSPGGGESEGPGKLYLPGMD